MLAQSRDATAAEIVPSDATLIPLPILTTPKLEAVAIGRVLVVKNPESLVSSLVLVGTDSALNILLIAVWS